MQAKHKVKLLLLSGVLLTASFLGSLVFTAQVEAAAAQCYWVHNKRGDIELLPECNRQWLGDNGFQLSGIPDPLPADVCYEWPYDPEQSASDVTSKCGNAPYSGAKSLNERTQVGPGTCAGNIAAGSECTPEEQAAVNNAYEEIDAEAARANRSIETTLETGRADIACGGGGDYGQVNLSFHIGCRQKGNPIIDMLFAVIRIITTGVGIALVASIIIAGVEYTTASGDPNKTSVAKKRLVSTLLVALPLYLLTYAILNWLIPLAVF